jgi:hypothetical protein
MLEILFTEPPILVRADALCIACLHDIPDIIVYLYRVLNHLHGWQYTRSHLSDWFTLQV